MVSAMSSAQQRKEKQPVTEEAQLEFKEELVFTQPDVGVGDLGGRIFVAEKRPLDQWFMISWQKSPYLKEGKPFVPVDWDPVEKTGFEVL